MEALSIVLIDKHPLARVGLGQMLADNFPMVQITESASIDSFWDRYSGISPDIIVVGLTQPVGGSRFEWMHLGLIHGIRNARAWYPDAKLIVYDHVVNPAMIQTYLNHGVMGYIDKESDASEVLLCVRMVRAGKRYLNNETLIRMLKEKRPRLKSEITEKATSLTRRQYEIACHLANGMPVKWIAVTLNVQSSTVSTIKTTIYQRLGVNTQHELRSALGAHGQLAGPSQNG